MMKVVQISSVHHSRDTRIFHKICKSLAGEGYEVDLIIQNDKDETAEGIRIKALPVAKKKWERLSRTIPALVGKCMKYPRGTVFHFHDPELIPVGFLLKMRGYKVIYDVHEDVPKSLLTRDWINPALRKTVASGVAFLEQMAKKFFDAIIVVTPKIRERFESEKTWLVQNFPVVSKERPFEIPDRKPKDKTVFYLGDITPVRGIKKVVQAMEILNKTEDINFVLGGKFSPPAYQKEISREEGWKYTEFVGWIGREEMAKYMGNAFAGVVPFQPVPNHIDAQPNKLFEYMLAGIPIVASNFPLWAEIVEANNCGILVDPESPEEIAEALLWLYTHPDKAFEMGKNGRNKVLEEYNWEAEKKKLLQLYARFEK